MSVLTLILPLTRQIDSDQLVHDFDTHLTSSLHSLYPTSKSNKPTSFIKLVTEHHNDNLVINIKPVLPSFELEKHSDDLYRAAAEWLATYIVHYYENELLKLAIKRRGFSNLDTINKIETYCQSILNHEHWEGLSRTYTEVDRKRRINKIVHELYSYFSAEVVCQLEGLLAFRLRPYKKEITDIVDYACDEYVLNQQYEEFISLIKYFVQIQECKIETVHIIQDEHGLELYDEHFNTIVVNDYEERIVVDMLETEINIEDSVISHLVAVSPNKIILHHHTKELYETKTVRSIFSDRIEMCDGCHLCKAKSSEMLPFN